MPSPTVISVENLSKVYRLGQIGTRALSEDLNRWWPVSEAGQTPTAALEGRITLTAKASALGPGARLG